MIIKTTDLQSAQAYPIRYEMVKCENCDGTGIISYARDEWFENDICPDCNGEGEWEEKE